MKILVIIPARGQSKGIPKKNICLMNGKPLIAYSIRNAHLLERYYDVDIVVDTEDEEIADVAGQYLAEVIYRPMSLANDDITLDPVIYHALVECEKTKSVTYDIVITMQPTSPTLKGITLLEAVNYFIKNDIDTLISAVNAPHLSWTEKDGKKCPVYVERKNRQYLPPDYVETGAFLITRRENVNNKSRIGKNVDIFEVRDDESIDIDTGMDWQLCELILKKKKIILRADGEECLGMGHIYRCLSIAYHLIGHDILFVTRGDRDLGVRKIQDSHFNYKTIMSDEDFFEIVQEEKPDIIVNDILDTNKYYIQKLKQMVKRVVNFEDKGEGSEYADCVINALYKDEHKKNHFYGFKYFFLRDEFLTARRKRFSDVVENVVVLFGGTDPCNLTAKVYDILQIISRLHPEIEFHIITGFGYPYKRELKNIEQAKIYVHNDVKCVSKYLENADMAITSQGRTIYELASMGIPSIVMAQNARELEHTFASVGNGFINLGMGENLSQESILSTIEWLIKTPNVRREMHEKLLEKDFVSGQKRIIKLVLGEEDEEDNSRTIES